MASLFAEGRIGEDDYHGVWGGVRFYFGQNDKTLDPPSPRRRSERLGRRHRWHFQYRHPTTATATYMPFGGTYPKCFVLD